jgi:RNA recognition motif-containing protein
MLAAMKRDGEKESFSVNASLSSNPQAEKPLPAGYVCNACGMAGSHAIYNCPLKKKKRDLAGATDAGSCNITNNTNERKKPKLVDADNSLEPSSNFKSSLFISGLPFEVSKNDVIQIITESGCIDVPSHKDIKLVMFDDNSKKCRGLCYVKLKSEEDFKKALKLNGKLIGSKRLSVQRSESRQKTKPAPVSLQKRCYRCGKPHDPSTCNNPRVCYRCGSNEHLSTNCPQKSKTD